MMRFLSLLHIFFAAIFFSSCESTNNKPVASRIYVDSFFYYIERGDAAYAAKTGIKSFEKSLNYYDTAQRIADDTKDTLLLAEAMFAKGRVYDGWNKEPLKTVEYFTNASQLFKALPNSYTRYLYVKHLVAHAYDKMHDSLNTVKVLKEIYHEIKGKDTSLLIQLPFTAEMALISTEVHSYPLAEAILKDLTRRSWIKNDTNTYDYLNHYYLTQSRLDVFYRHVSQSRFVDSLQVVFYNASNIFDKSYYASNLSKLYASMQRFDMAYKFLGHEKHYLDSINNVTDNNNMESALLKSELMAEKRKQEFQQALRQTRLDVIWLLSILLGIITVLSIYLQRQKKKYLLQTKRLASTNKLLDDKVQQIELLNKEIQHRVKNNLHMVFSLLQMQERRSEHEETTQNLQAAMLRIESIASLHNELANNSENPDLAKHIKGLVSSAVNCLSIDKKVITHINIDAAAMPAQHYFALSLILNEWITNTVKYATSKDDLIELNISVRCKGACIDIEFGDNGTNTAQQPDGLGTQIIKMLCRQVSGSLIKLNNNPYHYQLTIPYEQ
jgi:two-component sensor histidine kinase